MKKKDSLSSALKAAAGGETAEQPENATPAKNASTPEYRKGRVLIAGYFHPATKASLRMIQVQHVDKSVQDLLAEALNDLFAKYNVPQSARIQKKAAD